MKATFECYDALDSLRPPQEYEIISSFGCAVQPYVLGLWVSLGDTRVEPVYLTKEQFESFVNNVESR